MGPAWILPATLLLLGPPLVPGVGGRQEPPAPRQFLHQTKGECRFSNATGQEQVRLFVRCIYDRQEIARFDSALGRFEAVAPLGEPDAQYWNSQKEILQDYRAAVDTFCRYNYGVAETGRVVGRRAPRGSHGDYEILQQYRSYVERFCRPNDGEIFGPFSRRRRVQPTVTISPTKEDPLSPHTLLLCTAASFYPLEIEIRWLKNGREAKEGVFYGEELRNGDWTYQTQVMLETRPQRGDVYACQVEHASLETPITVQWEPRTSESARSKVWTGVVGALLGVVFVAVGLSLYLKSKKASPVQQPAALIG